MKIPVFTCIRRFPSMSKTAHVLTAALVLFCFAGAAVGASGGSNGEEHATEAKGWVNNYFVVRSYVDISYSQTDEKGSQRPHSKYPGSTQ